MPSTSVQITGLPAFLIGMTPLAVIGFFFLVIIVGMWRVFEKAGKPGWAAFVPIYNLVVTLDIAEKPIWWLFLMLIPGVNVIAWILVMVAFAERFGKGPLFGLGLTFLSMIFYPVLGFGEAQYSA